MRLKKEIIISILVIIISFGAYLYLFGFADRKVVFLYEHLGLTPFDRITIGRYWMTGFVLSGFLSFLYLIIQLITLYIIKIQQIDWQSILKYSWIPLISGILIITMTLGEPKIPFSIALSSAIALLIGLIIGFSVIDDWVRDFKSTIAYLAIGLGLVPFLILFRVLELPAKGIMTKNISFEVAMISFIGGFFWLLISNLLFKNNRPELINVIKGTLVIAYLGLPLLHYLTATPKGIPYITASNNFFADNIILRITNWILFIFIVFFADRLTKRKMPID